VQNRSMIYLFLLFAGGFLYVVLEFFWRGYSHVSMAFAGGLCTVLMYGVLTRIPQVILPIRALIGTVIITAVEFVVGAVVNVRMKLNVWDYSALPMNCYGQICLQYSILWLLLSVPAVVLIDVVYRLYG